MGKPLRVVEDDEPVRHKQMKLCIQGGLVRMEEPSEDEVCDSDDGPLPDYDIHAEPELEPIRCYYRECPLRIHGVLGSTVEYFKHPENRFDVCSECWYGKQLYDLQDMLQGDTPGAWAIMCC